MNEIQLQHNRLTGTLPTELGELTAMNEISVSANPELCGEVPADVVVSSTTGTALGESCTAGPFQASLASLIVLCPYLFQGYASRAQSSRLLAAGTSLISSLSLQPRSGAIRAIKGHLARIAIFQGDCLALLLLQHCSRPIQAGLILPP
ncbi:hypothetical protein CYMTET_17442 [Cymbomonas tetramitiformis]|uniref:Uncharacterized protein n=1 Tax=Cymbomonas tetramitiformis TaxID=36881 RepID=A0AAE0GBI8_9CHLO|nr:hypothetical protein CYMTET_17442 [Cymbomonas tetramitiformis]